MLGPHVSRTWATGGPRPSITDHIEAARADASSHGVDAQVFQIFVAGPRQAKITLAPEERAELREYAAATGRQVVAHGAYTDYPWHGNPAAFKAIQDEIAVCEAAGVFGLVIHLGAPTPDEILPHLKKFPPSTVLLFLENPHTKPEKSHYETPEKLARLFEAVRTVDPRLCQFGLCIDTAHLWSSGADIQGFEAAEDWLARFERTGIPADRVMFHLNDSHDDRGSGLDHHAPLLAGKIWKKYADCPQKSGLAAFVDYVVRNGCHAVLERGAEGNATDYHAVKRLSGAFDAA